MYFAPLPETATWRHRGAREGFEVVFFGAEASRIRVKGQTTAVEDGQPWSVRYDIVLDPGWLTRHVRVWALSATGERETTLQADGRGGWHVNGSIRPDLDGCLDVDLESSACTNTFPVHRLGLDVGEEADAPATYVRALDLSVERLEQRYVRETNSQDHHQRYSYRAPVFDFEGRLAYDESGLVVEYPGIASRMT